jgi:hypothetical protein
MTALVQSDLEILLNYSLLHQITFTSNYFVMVCYIKREASFAHIVTNWVHLAVVGDVLKLPVITSIG